MRVLEVSHRKELATFILRKRTSTNVQIGLHHHIVSSGCVCHSCSAISIWSQCHCSNDITLGLAVIVSSSIKIHGDRCQNIGCRAATGAETSAHVIPSALQEASTFYWFSSLGCLGWGRSWSTGWDNFVCERARTGKTQLHMACRLIVRCLKIGPTVGRREINVASSTSLHDDSRNIKTSREINGGVIQGLDNCAIASLLRSTSWGHASDERVLCT